MLKEYRRLLPWFRKYLPMYIPGIICLLVTDAGLLYIPRLTKEAIDIVAAGSPDLQLVLRLCLLMTGIALLVTIGRFGWRYFITGSARRIESGLRSALFQHILGLQPDFFEKRKTGDIMARFTNDMRAIRMACGMAVVSLVDGVFMAAFILVILFVNYPALAGWIIIPLPVLAVLVLGMGRMLGRRTKRVQESFASLSSIVQETFSGIRVFKTLSRESYAVDKFSESNDEYIRRSMSLVRIWGLFFPLINFLAGCTTLLLLWFGGLQVIDGVITPGDFAAVLSYLNLLVWPMMGAGFTINWLERGAASLSRVGELLDAESDIKTENTYGQPDEEPRGGLEVRNLEFCWPESTEPVLEGISFSLPRGSTLGIFGRTGSGKSSLVNLIPRLYDPPPETIFIGGRDIRSFDLKKLRGAVGLVPQESFLFSETIKENISFAADGAPDEKIMDAAEFSTIARDLNEFPFGWDTMVGERGHSLSGGQKQRIAVSRAYLTDPEIIIFDDCLSAVDAETESNILNQFIKKRAGRTSIIISNRTASLASADLIIVLEDGRISARGTHSELIEQKGLYRSIYRLQQVEHERR
ncbi:MAG: ABC transporter ATP-binding protein [Spirochaetales bacterium]|uniref:ABC transporter ATP-binding protein n=1 Tax=Candidatus Thalassospirochaeta sargassi TaxID=3119039 RepID=A0AAJ1MM12_9SPIO|nr:ABC transporter ATP-binding protein [Spirochaetales bacterium]